jgi:hypothetical protein
MINYCFFQFIKKKIWTGPDRPVGVRPRGPTVGRVRVFRIWTALDRTVRNVRDRGPWTVQDRGPSGFEPARTGPSSILYINEHGS